MKSLKPKIRGWILHWNARNKWWMPHWLHMYIMCDLPFQLSIIDKRPLTEIFTEAQLKEIEERALELEREHMNAVDHRQ